MTKIQYTDGRARVRTGEERVLYMWTEQRSGCVRSRAGWSWEHYKWVREVLYLYSMRSLVSSQCRYQMMVWYDIWMIWALTTVLARQRWICWRRFIWDLGRFQYRELQQSSLEWAIDAAMVLAVLESR